MRRVVVNLNPKLVAEKKTKNNTDAEANSLYRKISISETQYYRENNFEEAQFSRMRELEQIGKEQIGPEAKSFKYGAAIDVLFAVCSNYRPKLVLETGVAFGWSSLVFLDFLKENNGELVSFDMPYLDNLNTGEKVGKAVPPELRKFWRLIRLPDFDALKIIKKENTKFDLVHYDSDKSYHGRTRTYSELWNLLKPGGVFVSDDIGDNLAFADFCEKNNLTPIIIQILTTEVPKFIGIILK